MRNCQFDIPAYFYREYTNDFGIVDSKNPTYFHQVNRVVQVALPFISLYQPAGKALSIVLGVSRSVTCLFSLKHAYTNQHANIPQVFLQTTIAVASLACAIVMPPLGMLIATAQDLIVHATQLVEALKNQDYAKALKISADILNNSLYLSLFVTGASEIVIASLALQILLGLYHSWDEFKDEKYLEGAGRLLMACIRGNQLITEIGILRLQRAIDQHMLEIEQHALMIESDADKMNALSKIIHNKKNKNKNKDKAENTSKEISNAAKTYYQRDEVHNRKMQDLDLSKSLDQSADDTAIIDTLLQDQRGFCIGEIHYDIAARRFLMDNINYLKSKNVKVIFSEGWDFTIQKTVDKFFSVKHLRQLSRDDRKKVDEMLTFSKYAIIKQPNTPYTLFATMLKAKEAGIRWVGIDYCCTLSSMHIHENDSSQERISKMNFVAIKTIEATTKTFSSESKFVAFMGAAHLRATHDIPNIPGVADLTQTPAIWPQDRNLSNIYDEFNIDDEFNVDFDLCKAIQELRPTLSYSGIAFGNTSLFDEQHSVNILIR